MMQVDVENDDTVDIVFEMRVDGTDGYIVHKAEPGRCILQHVSTKRILDALLSHLSAMVTGRPNSNKCLRWGTPFA